MALVDELVAACASRTFGYVSFLLRCRWVVRGWFGGRGSPGAPDLGVRPGLGGPGVKAELDGHERVQETVLAGAVAVGRATEQEPVEVGALVVCCAAVSPGLYLALHLVQLLQLLDRTARAAGVDTGVLRERADRRPRAAIAIVVRDSNEDELRRSGRTGVVKGDRNRLDAHDVSLVDRF